MQKRTSFPKVIQVPHFDNTVLHTRCKALSNALTYSYLTALSGNLFQSGITLFEKLILSSIR